MLGKPKKWETYEQVANHLLNRMADEFGLERVEGKQKIQGLRSGTEWEIEGKGVVEGQEAFLIVECRRYTTKKLSQETVGGLAFRIADTGAEGAILVTPLGLQEGAEKVATSEDIIHVLLDENSSSTEYIMKFLDKIKMGLAGEISPKGSLSATIIKKDGTTEDRSC